MFGVDTTELLIVALAALIFIGPKELPGAMRTVGRWVGRARAHARHFTAGIENMMREAELEEMEKRWREENERIMREHPVALPYVGASEELGAGSSTMLGTNEPGDDQNTPAPLVPGDAEARNPPAPTLDDEPPLPLPEPEHHRRELP
ncbi:twin-arginine translocase subunit TatB [Sphingomonas sp. LHG3406-1]|uniref:Sec-independent protein translocase subunit TatA/TatB n=1 Tax=Sphingomonas sp. LHG3406-1 TaxID=2804617 RepID=UPI00261C3942|nr:twin-arginine translocase subunit TatB [Sphingomonas sp. LHG3406-1]